MIFIYKYKLDCNNDVQTIDFGDHLQYISFEADQFVRKLSNNVILSSIDTKGTVI